MTYMYLWTHLQTIMLDIIVFLQHTGTTASPSSQPIQQESYEIMNRECNIIENVPNVTIKF